MYYDNEKLNEIFRDTWPNLGWAAKLRDEKLKQVKTNDRPSTKVDERNLGGEKLLG